MGDRPGVVEFLTDNPCTPRRDRKSAEVVENKADMCRPWRRGVRNSMKPKGLNERGGNDHTARERGLWIEWVLKLNKHTGT
jgi:hypothetical protein